MEVEALQFVTIATPIYNSILPHIFLIINNVEYSIFVSFISSTGGTRYNIGVEGMNCRARKSPYVQYIFFLFMVNNEQNFNILTLLINLLA